MTATATATPQSSSAAPGSTPSTPPTTAPVATLTPSPPPTAATFDPSRVNLGLQLVLSGLDQPVFATGAGDGSGRLFIVEQPGLILVVGADGKLAASPFLDLRSKVTCCGERGLLGLAFSPSYASDGHLFVDYTDTAGNTVVARFTRLDAGHADPASERVLLHIQQPFPNHKGGMLAFGPDGDLYIGMGDGGSEGDPQNNGQRLDTLLGKLLRIDVSGDPYSVPASNPFVGRSGARPEIFDYGLRNPWRYSFDRQTGALFIGDVGQNLYEEVDAVPPGGPGGLDFGWRIMEGDSCYNATTCTRHGLTLPVYTYSHAFGCAIVGGYVYRGTTYPALEGAYLFSDDCSGRIWGMDAASALRGPTSAKVLLESGLTVSSFGQDDAGELYICDLGGKLYHITADAQ
ncbi:MAG TPA: PQQ-dependent sugar dehydrogenase [Candidatus Baltobacteraceae bacterium]|nr:PQQ-dependent sugar dehydrogenase [Candidatus Baltobacteraceae bacterium]